MVREEGRGKGTTSENESLLILMLLQVQEATKPPISAEESKREKKRHSSP